MKTFQEIINEANIIFNNKYKYVEMFIKNNIRYIRIKCKIHGIFEKNIYNHIKKKQGCSLCSKPAKLTKEMFIEKSIVIHGKLYDYSNVSAFSSMMLIIHLNMIILLLLCILI